MRKVFLGLFTLLLVQKTVGQSITYFKDIEPIVSKNCGTCHRPGGIGPFSLQTYDEVSKKGKFVAHVTKTKYMPPWKADIAFRSFRNERTLRPEEIEMIEKWVMLRMPKGKKVIGSKTNTIVENSIQPDRRVHFTHPINAPDLLRCIGHDPAVMHLLPVARDKLNGRKLNIPREMCGHHKKPKVLNSFVGDGVIR